MTKKATLALHETHRYQEFIRRVLHSLEMPELPNAIPDDERPAYAVRLTDAFIDAEGMDLTDSNAVKVAAVMAAMDSDVEEGASGE